MQKLGVKIAIVGVWSVLALLGCASSQESPETPANPEPAANAEAASPEALPAEQQPPAGTSAAAKTVDVAFQSKSGSKLTGSATLTETPEGVKVALAVDNVAPGDHGAHVHEKGDCSSPDGESAGGHFNPSAQPHALPSQSPRHLGDLGNITVGSDGKGTLEIVAADANLEDGDPSSFLGRAIIIHEKKDDGGQPTGNAGGRIGCAEIK
jgi:Cu-Zn family superoxide dismutase